MSTAAAVRQGLGLLRWVGRQGPGLSRAALEVARSRWRGEPTAGVAPAVAVAAGLIRRVLERGAAGPVADLRRAMEAVAPDLPLDPRLTLTRQLVQGLPCEIIEPRSAPHRLDLLYLHGGGYVFGSAAEVRDLTAAMALHLSARVVAPNYRLAPEHPFPAALDDALAVAGALGEQRPWMAAGDSAGGGLALAAAMALRDRGGALPRGLILLSPWVDLTKESRAHHGSAPPDYLPPELARIFAPLYLGDLEVPPPLASPLQGDLSGLPPVLLLAGAAESLLEDSLRLGERLRDAGVPVTSIVEPGQVHVYPHFAPISASARAAFEHMKRFVRPLVDGPT